MPIPPGMARSTVDLPVAHREALDAARAEDGVDVTARIRAMVRLWVEDPQLAKRVDEMALEARRDRYARSVATRAKGAAG